MKKEFLVTEMRGVYETYNKLLDKEPKIPEVLTVIDTDKLKGLVIDQFFGEIVFFMCRMHKHD